MKPLPKWMKGNVMPTEPVATGLVAWKKMFYPVEVYETNIEDAATHSLRKWQGLTVGVLREFGLQKAPGERELRDQSGKTFSVDADTCSLCFHFRDADSGNPCEMCPLSLVRGRVTCFENTRDETVSPYVKWTSGGNPFPMLMWLKRTVRYMELTAKKKEISKEAPVPVIPIASVTGGLFRGKRKTLDGMDLSRVFCFLSVVWNCSSHK